MLLRFAPSPTGPLHLGGLRMALYNYLFARKHAGKWIVRIEDTDGTRTVPGSVEGIRKALDWAGLDYDYGPHKDGPHGPYFQSERLDLYRSYAKKLLDSGHAYRCFCSPDKLASIKERLARSGSPYSYDRTCLHLTDEEVARKVRAGEKFVVRVNDTHRPSRPPTTDIVFGSPKDAHGSTGLDSVLLKSDSFPTYHLASVVDDHEMGITHVLRGQEWLTSLPLHLDLYAYLGLTPPQFAHVPVLLNPDGTKMSKRKGDVQVIDYIRRGWEPTALLNWIALAGWGARHEPQDPNSPSNEFTKLVQEAPSSTAVMDLREMIDAFDLSALTQRNCSLDPEKLEYLNKHHLVRTWSTPKGLDTLAHKAHEKVKEAFPSSQYTDVDSLKRVIKALDGRLTNIQDIPQLAPYLFIEPDWTTDEAKAMIRKVDPSHIVSTLSSVIEDLQSNASEWNDLHLSVFLAEQREKLGINQKVFMTALRYALTGRKDGPPVADIMRVLGLQRLTSRLQNVVQNVQC